jgi:ribosomal protein S4E
VLFNCVLEYAIRRVQANHEGLKVNGTLQHLIYVGHVSVESGSTHTTKKNTKSLIAASKEIGLALNADEGKQMVMSCGQHLGQNHNITTVHKFSERVEQVTYLGTITYQN